MVMVLHQLITLPESIWPSKMIVYVSTHIFYDDITIKIMCSLL